MASRLGLYKSMSASARGDEKSTFDTIEGAPARLIISEPGFYKLTETSRKPTAKNQMSAFHAKAHENEIIQRKNGIGAR